MDCAVIRVRYKDLSPGLHGKAEHSGRGATVYLLPGLTGRQRKAALRRLRQEASRGCGPALPLPQLTVALALDQVRSACRRTAAVVRLHPAGSLLPTAVAGTLMTMFVLASVSVRIGHVPQAAPDGAPVGSGSSAVPAASSHTIRVSGPVSAVPGAVSAVPGAGGAGARSASGGGQVNTSWSLVASSGAGTGGTGLGAWARSGSGSGAGSDAGSGSTSGSGSGPGWESGSWPGCGTGVNCGAVSGYGYMSGLAP